MNEALNILVTKDGTHLREVTRSASKLVRLSSLLIVQSASIDPALVEAVESVTADASRVNVMLTEDFDPAILGLLNTIRKKIGTCAV